MDGRDQGIVDGICVSIPFPGVYHVHGCLDHAVPGLHVGVHVLEPDRHQYLPQPTPGALVGPMQ